MFHAELKIFFCQRRKAMAAHAPCRYYKDSLSDWWFSSGEQALVKDVVDPIRPLVGRCIPRAKWRRGRGRA